MVGMVALHHYATSATFLGTIAIGAVLSGMQVLRVAVVVGTNACFAIWNDPILLNRAAAPSSVGCAY